MRKSVCRLCNGNVILQEGSTLEAVGYGYGTFVCLNCGHESSYYGEDVKVKLIEVKD